MCLPTLTREPHALRILVRHLPTTLTQVPNSTRILDRRWLKRGLRRHGNTHFTQHLRRRITQRTPGTGETRHTILTQRGQMDRRNSKQTPGRLELESAGEPLRHTQGLICPSRSPCVLKRAFQHAFRKLSVRIRNRTLTLTQQDATLTKIANRNTPADNLTGRNRLKPMGAINAALHQRLERNNRLGATHHAKHWNTPYASLSSANRLPGSCPANEERIAVTFGQRQGTILFEQRFFD
jgi:hypothetical protein